MRIPSGPFRTRILSICLECVAYDLAEALHSLVEDVTKVMVLQPRNRLVMGRESHLLVIFTIPVSVITP